MPVDAAARAGLSTGRALDRRLARQLARELRRSQALETAARALRGRDHSAASLEERLARRSIAPAARAEALATLQAAGLVDDERFARGRAEALARRGWGDAGVWADLERQGVPAASVEAAIGGLEPEAARLARLVRRRGATPATARFLAARGFDPDAVADALGGLVAGED